MKAVAKKRYVAMLREELKSDVLKCYYIIIAKPGKFLGAVVIKARGPIEAWRLMHSLSFFPTWPEEADTQTYEVPEDVAKRFQRPLTTDS